MMCHSHVGQLGARFRTSIPSFLLAIFSAVQLRLTPLNKSIAETLTTYSRDIFAGPWRRSFCDWVHATRRRMRLMESGAGVCRGLDPKLGLRISCNIRVRMPHKWPTTRLLVNVTATRTLSRSRSFRFAQWSLLFDELGRSGTPWYRLCGRTGIWFRFVYAYVILSTPVTFVADRL